MRWALFGPAFVYLMQGGPGGMAWALEQFDPARIPDWSHNVYPPITEELKATLDAQTREQMDGRTLEEWERLRDEFLVRVIEAKRELFGDVLTNDGRRRAHAAPAAPRALTVSRVASRYFLRPLRPRAAVVFFAWPFWRAGADFGCTRASALPAAGFAAAAWPAFAAPWPRASPSAHASRHASPAPSRAAVLRGVRRLLARLAEQLLGLFEQLVRLGDLAPGAAAVDREPHGRLPDLLDPVDRHEGHVGAQVLGHVLEVDLVARRQDHGVDAGALRGQRLLLEAADGQHLAGERDLAGHRHLTR